MSLTVTPISSSFSQSMPIRPTVFALSSIPLESILPPEVQMLSSVCGMWKSWCVFAASQGQLIHTKSN